MAVIFLLVVIAFSMVVVRIAAVALELTGMPWDQAKFQALSSFSNCGFATREAEAVMHHPVRRRIVTWLIVLGNAGIVTTIGTFAGSMMQTNLIGSLTNVGFIAAGLLLLIWIARWRGLSRRMRNALQRWMRKRYDFHAPTAEELLHLEDGYHLTRIELTEGSPAAGRLLSELELKKRLVQILAIERGARFTPIPRGSDRLQPGDCLIVYGAEESLYEVFQPYSTQRLTIVGSPDEHGAVIPHSKRPVQL